MLSAPRPGSWSSGMPRTIDGACACLLIGRASVRKLDFRLAAEDVLAGLRAHLRPHLHQGKAVGRLVDLLDDLGVHVGHIALEGRAAELRHRMPDVAL